MFLSKITLFENIATSHQHSRLGEVSEYRIHQYLWELFPETPKGERPFLYRQEVERALPFFYVLSKIPPMDIKGHWNIESREFNPALKEGDRLAFSLRANPIVTKKDEHGKARRHDVVMEAKTQLRKIGIPKESWPSQATLEWDASVKWLTTRSSKGGFKIDPNGIEVFGYRQLRMEKRKSTEPIRISVVDFQGVLVVTEPSVFLKDSVFSGIGAAKGFGCGLMMLKRI